MTRDEAVKAFQTSTPNPNSFSTEDWIDRFVALGMLKLDEPKFPNHAQRIDCAIAEMGWASLAMPAVLKFCGLNIEQAIRHAGLKIVESADTHVSIPSTERG